jgi:hypothetical protein
VEALSAHLMDLALQLHLPETTTPDHAQPNGDGLENLTRDEIAALLAHELSALEEGKIP